MAKPDQWMDLARKMSADPRIQRNIAEAFFNISTSNPALGRRLLNGDPTAVREAYQLLVRNGGTVPMPAGAPRLDARPIGPGEAVGGVSGPGVPVSPGTALVPSPRRGLPHDPSATRALTTTDGPPPSAMDGSDFDLDMVDEADDGGVVIYTDPDAAPRGRWDDIEAEGILLEGDPEGWRYGGDPRPSDGELIPYRPSGPGVRVGGVGGPPVPATPRLRGKPAVRAAQPSAGGVPGWVVPAAAGAYGVGVGVGALNSVRPRGVADDDLDAAATEIAPDEDVGAPGVAARASAAAGGVPSPRTWRDMDDEEMAANLPHGDAPGGGVGVRRGELEEYGRRYRHAIHNIIDRGVESRQAARRAGYTDLPDEDGTVDGRALPNGTPTVLVDGVRVPVVRNSAGDTLGFGGKQYYRFRDVKAAKEAQQEARRTAQIQESSRRDNEQFGLLHPDATALVRHARNAAGQPLYKDADGKVTTDRFKGEPIIERTPSQDLHGYGMEYGPDHKPINKWDTKSSLEQVERWQDNTVARRDMEARTRQGAAYTAAQAARFAESTGLPVAEVEATLSQPGGRARLAAMAKDQYIAKQRLAKDRVAARAFLAGGSQHINGRNSALLNALVTLQGVDPADMDAQQQALMQNIPMDPVRAQVEGRRWDMAGRLAGDVVTGALAGQGGAGAGGDALARKNADDAAAWFDNWHANRIPGAVDGPYTNDQHDMAVRYMMNRFRVDRPTAEAIAQSHGVPTAARPTPSNPPAWSPVPVPGEPSSHTPPPGPPPMPRSMPL